jgi:hypothetical protein
MNHLFHINMEQMIHKYGGVSAVYIFAARCLMLCMPTCRRHRSTFMDLPLVSGVDLWGGEVQPKLLRQVIYLSPLCCRFIRCTKQPLTLGSNQNQDEGKR